MTPCINLLKKQKITHKIHEYEHDSASSSYGIEAATKLKLPQEQVFKTLVVSDEKNILAVAVIPVSKKLSLKAMAKTIGAKKVSMADPKAVEKTTGYILGGVSPLGQKKRLKTVIDKSAKEFDTIYVSGGRRGLDVELSPLDMEKLLDAVFWDVVTL